MVSYYYPGKMEGFLNKNPGLRSRIAFHVNFPDYTQDELMGITRLMVKNQKLTLEPESERVIEISSPKLAQAKTMATAVLCAICSKKQG